MLFIIQVKEVAVHRCSTIEQLFWNISQNSKKNSRKRISFDKVPDLGLRSIASNFSRILQKFSISFFHDLWKSTCFPERNWCNIEPKDHKNWDNGHPKNISDAVFVNVANENQVIEKITKFWCLNVFSLAINLMVYKINRSFIFGKIITQVC